MEATKKDGERDGPPLAVEKHGATRQGTRRFPGSDGTGGRRAARAATGKEEPASTNNTTKVVAEP
jgi:hypothetical protein